MSFQYEEGSFSSALIVYTAMAYFTGVSAECDNTAVRLSPGPNQGVLEILHSGTWGTICDRYFTNTAAAVVCRSINQTYSNAYRVYATEVSTHAVKPSVVSRVKCTSGVETSLCDCDITYNTRHCTQKSLIGVVCTDALVAATWQYKGHWLGLEVKEVTINVGDNISCAAINDTSRFMSTRIYVPGQTETLVSNVGKGTLKDIQKSLQGRLTCSVWNGKTQQRTSTIQLNVVDPEEDREKESTPVYIYIVSVVVVVAVIAVVAVVVVVIKRRSRRSNARHPEPISHRGAAFPEPRSDDTFPDRTSQRASTQYMIAVDINMSNGESLHRRNTPPFLLWNGLERSSS